MQVDLKYETARRRMIIGIIGCLLYVAGDFLFAATGALMSVKSSKQGESIPGISHIVHLSSCV